MKLDMFIRDGDALRSMTVLSSHPVFSAFSTDSLMELISGCSVNTYEAKEVLVGEGDLVDAVFFILEGQCEVRKHTINVLDEPIDQPLATLTEEESIGLSEVGLFSSTGSRTASVVALSFVKVLSLSVKAFRLFLKDHPHAGETFSKQLDMLLRMHFIKAVAPFSAVSNKKIREIAEQIEEISLAADTTIFSQGDSGDACYIITAGQVEISHHASDGSQKIIARLGENAIFGESALMMDVPRSATARVLEPTTLLKINKPLFNGITHQHVNAREASMRLQLERCRPLKLNNIDVYTQRNMDGDEIAILRNTELGHYLQLSEQGLFLWNLLDGELSLNEITLQFFRQFNVFHVDDIAIQIMNLHNAGFIELDRNETMPRSLGPFAKRIAPLRKFIEHRILIENADERVGTSFNRIGWLFYSKFASPLWMLIAVCGFVSFAVHFERSMVLLAQSPYKWIWFFLSLLMATSIIPLYVLARAYTIKHAKRNVHFFCFGWRWFLPFAYCDTSDMWLRSKKQRVLVDIAGMYLNAMLAGLMGLCVFFLFPAYPDITIILELVALSLYLLILANMHTAFELDGYCALMNALDKPNLRQSSIRWIIALFSSHDDALDTTWENVKKHSKEAIYWLVTMVCIGVITPVVTYVVFSYLLVGLFGVSSPVMVMALTLLVVIATLFSLYKDFLLHISI